MIFAFTPLLLMAGAFYFRSRTLLGNQVSAQMRNQLAAELNQLDLANKVRQIRLDNLVRQPDFDSELDSAISADPHSINFTEIRNNLSQQMRSLTPQADNATFNQFFLMLPDGIILMDSQQEWEGSSLANSQYYQSIANGNDQTFAVYNFPPLYKNQLVLLTVTQYQKEGDLRQGTLVGVTEQQSLQGVLQSLVSLTPSSNAYFFTHEGKLIGIDSHTMELAILSPSPSQNTQLSTAFNILMNSAKSMPQSLQFSDSNNLPVLAQVEWLPSMNAGLVWEIPQDVVFGQLNNLAPITLIIIVIALLAMAIVIIMGTQRVFKPLQSLTTITSKFASGDFSVRAEVRGQDEIGMLADLFNHMAEELTGLYRSLEQKVEERTRQIRIAAEIVQRTISSNNLDELLNRTTELIVQQFGFYHAAIYLVDRAGKHAVLRSACGPAAHTLLESGHQLEVGASSIIGWVTANNQPHITSDVTEDSLHMENKLLPETHSEAAVPISVGGDVFGALDVQSTQSSTFGPDVIVTLQTLASQIAVAIHNISLSESTQGNTRELERLYQSNLRIATAQSKDELIQITNGVLQDSPFASGILLVHGSQLEVVAMNRAQGKSLAKQAVENLGLNLREIQKFLSGNPIIVEEGSMPWPVPLRQFRKGFEYQSVAFLPIKQASQTTGLIVLGGQKESLTSALVQPYIGMTELVGIMLEKIEDAAEKQNSP